VGFAIKVGTIESKNSKLKREGYDLRMVEYG